MSRVGFTVFARIAARAGLPGVRLGVVRSFSRSMLPSLLLSDFRSKLVCW